MTRHVYVRVRTGAGRRENITLSGCTGPLEIETRKAAVLAVAKQLAEGGRADRVRDICTQIGAATSDKLVALVRRSVKELLQTESAPPESVLFKTHARDWTTGELHVRYPDHVGKKKSSKDDKAKLRLYINPILGEIPLVRVRLEDAQIVMRRLPPELSRASRRHVAQILHKLLTYAVYPCKIIKANPLPPGFLPRLNGNKAKQYLYPDEEGKLLGCTLVPVEYRIAYGVLTREGMRTGELFGNPKMKTPALGWDCLDLERGVITLDRNKTDDPRAWALDPSTLRALRIWKQMSPRGPFASINPNNFARRFREHLLLAEVDRAELTAEATDERRPIRAHDLRATFITVGYATGRSEGWMQDRTGHTSSVMLNRYRRVARKFTELGLGRLGAMDELIPELAQGGQLVGKSDEAATGRVAS